MIESKKERERNKEITNDKRKNKFKMIKTEEGREMKETRSIKEGRMKTRRTCGPGGDSKQQRNTCCYFTSEFRTTQGEM
jgi:hypothetical protein